MHVGEHRALRFDSPDPGKRLLDAEMAWMTHVAERIDDPHIEVLEVFERFLGQVADIRRIGDAAEAKTERLS